MTPQRLKQLRAHAEAHRHVTTAMALELLEHVAELEAEAAKWKHRTGVMADREGAALSRAEAAEACAECGHLARGHYNGCSGFMRIAAALQPGEPYQLCPACRMVSRVSQEHRCPVAPVLTQHQPKENHMQPSVGRVVHYRLTLDDSYAIARRRTTGSSIADRIKDKAWPLGAQAHIGNPVNEGDILPLIISRVWPDEYGPGVPGVNGQVLLDGNDQLWVTSVKEGDGPGQWTWPPRV